MDLCQHGSDTLRINTTTIKTTTNITWHTGEFSYCSEALQKYVDVFSWMLISQIFGPLFFGVISHFFGLFIARLLASSMFSTGVVLLSMYKTRSDLILWKE